MLRPTVSGLLRRDFGSLLLAIGIPVGFVLAVVTHGAIGGMWTVIGGAAITLACGVIFVRCARCHIATDGTELHARGWLFSAVDCKVADRVDGLMHARISIAGGLAGGLATAVTLALFVLTGSPHLLPWVAAGAAANLFGSLMPFMTVDVEAILLVVGRWLPAVGVFAALAAGAAAAGLGVADPLIPVIVFLAFVVLRSRYPGRWQRDQGVLSTRARLVIAGAWLTLTAYLSLVFFLTAGWLV